MGQPGSADGGPGTARFQGPYSVAIAPNGTVWVTDQGNAGSALRQVAADGSVHTVATSASTGLSFGTGRLAFDPAGNLFMLAGGLYQIDTATGTATVLIPSSQNGTAFGAASAIGPADRLTAIGVKQLVFESLLVSPLDSGQLVRATVP